MKTFDQKDRLALIDKLEENGLFIDALWNLSDLYYDDTIKTACVEMRGDRIRMLFNKEFYESLGERGQMFVVCHEQLHIMSNHFERMEFGEGDADNKNKAADVSINHSLIRNYFFTKEDLPNWERYCWTDTVFPDQVVSDNETAEYYYMLLKQRMDLGKSSGGIPLDEHNPVPSNKSEAPSKEIQKALDKARDELFFQFEANDDGDTSAELPADIEQLLDKKSIHGSVEQEHHTKSRKRVASWKQVFLQIPKSIVASRQGEHWINRNRNHRLLPSGLMMPGSFEVSYQDKVRVRVYLDTSGSCIGHAKHFLESALTLPPNMFDVEMYGFCANVYDLPKKPPYTLTGFGCESYPAVENHVEDQKDVDAVMVFTDGYSAIIHPKNPHKWHWFITPDGTTDNIDPKCNTYMLEKFGWPVVKG